MTGRRNANPPLPAVLRGPLADYRFQRIDTGQSGSTVYALQPHAGAADLYLKHATDEVAVDLKDEALRLRWMHGRVPVPRVVDFVQRPGRAWLVTTALPGQTAHALMAAGPAHWHAVVDAIASFLHQVHAMPIDECPFRTPLASRMACARRRVDAGQVDVDDFDDDREGWTAEEVWQALLGQQPRAEDLVFTHGDFSLDNILLHDGAVSGCIDVGRAAVADRYQDLAILWNNLGEFGSACQQRFLRSYGLSRVNRRKLHFYLMLDELF